MKKGVFIVLDGLDGSGKGTQTKMLVERLQQEGHQVEMVDFPQYGTWSAVPVEKYLRGELGSSQEITAQQASLFYALDRFSAKKRMQDALIQGKILIANRYVSASKGHQLGKLTTDQQRKEFLDWLNHTEYTILGIPKPTATLFLHMPPEIGQKLVEKKSPRAYLQGKSKDIHEEDIEHLRNAERGFLFAAQHDTQEKWNVIKCSKEEAVRSIDEIHQEIYQTVARLIGEK
ncbi:hypothetical protein HYV86_01020 [Candidatus Woesearchaeota archaeon]|nr:hypothetical protein [Candidatus Woesearchaeota archaeon]